MESVFGGIQWNMTILLFLLPYFSTTEIQLSSDWLRVGCFHRFLLEGLLVSMVDFVCLKNEQKSEI